MLVSFPISGPPALNYVCLLQPPPSFGISSATTQDSPLTHYLGLCVYQVLLRPMCLSAVLRYSRSLCSRPPFSSLSTSGIQKQQLSSFKCIRLRRQITTIGVKMRVHFPERHLPCFVMDPSDIMGNLNHMVGAVRLNGAPAPDHTTGQKETSPADMLRMRQQMSNQCFEMTVQINAGKSRRSCSTSEAERDLPDHVDELERIKTTTFNRTLALHRMQMWHAIGEKLKQTDPEADFLTALSDRCLALCSQIKTFQQESSVLQDEITEIQKKRLEMKRLTHEKMKEIEELMKKQHPHTEKYKAVLEKGQDNLEKYRKMIVMTQNVLRGVLMACKINWLDDPKLRDIAMSLEDIPISD
ncbi:centromere protein H [Xyrichtys novacula]|uniref:Centromere protein H n=2 Tax=Xyrichtys novacula TaxID=13765 RepID=A0AAV1G7Q6_XYRNO|nr:centromere protein H [Xyrichtys novacula]